MKDITNKTNKLTNSSSTSGGGYGDEDTVEVSYSQELSPSVRSNQRTSARTGDQATDDVSIRELLVRIGDVIKFLMSKWVIIAFAALLGGLIGLTYAFYKKPVYTAELSFALEDEKSVGGLGGALGLASQFGFDLGGTGGGVFSGDNLLELMKSRSMVQKTLLTPVQVGGKEQTLAELYITYNNLRDKWEKKPQLSSVAFLPGADPKTFTRTQDSLLGEFHEELIKENLTVNKIDKKLSIISVKISAKDELFAKHFTEVLVKEVADFYIETKTRRSALNVNILQHQTDSVRRQLNSAISGVAASVDANPNVNPSRQQVLRVPSQRRQVDVQANQAILTELVKNLEISKVSLRKETPLIQVIDTPILPLEQKKLSKVLSTASGIFLGVFLSSIVLLFRRILKEA